MIVVGVDLAGGDLYFRGEDGRIRRMTELQWTFSDLGQILCPTGIDNTFKKDSPIFAKLAVEHNIRFRARMEAR